MWTRKSVKEKGKKSFFVSYWKCVLVGLILCAILGAGSSFGSSSSGYIPSLTNIINRNDDAGDDIDDTVSDITGDIDPDIDIDDIDVDADGFHIDIDTDIDDDEIAGLAVGAFVVLFTVILVISLIITAFSLAFRYLLLAPIEYGCRKFFRKNLDEPAKLSNIVYVFGPNYKSVVKTAFLRDLFIWLWSLLFIVPGIIKAYEYRLVPYIVSENPSINFKDALAESKKLMQGNKWKAFVLDLSFIGWDILSLLTWGMLDIFFVGPYKASTDAALYETLKYGIDAK